MLSAEERFSPRKRGLILKIMKEKEVTKVVTLFKNFYEF